MPVSVFIWCPEYEGLFNFLKINVSIQKEYPARCYHSFMHKNPETYKKNPIATGDFKWIFCL